MATLDVLSLHLQLSDRTSGLTGRADLNRMKPGADLSNTSRGPIIDEAALAEALQRRAIAGAALDVLGIEPLPADIPFLTLDNVLLTPHIGYVHSDSYDIFFRETLEDVEAYMDGTPSAC